jgi:hypothetical protein
MSFLHILFRGKTNTPWHVGKLKYGDYLYTRSDYLWGRGIRGPMLRQLWRTYCYKSDLVEKTRFNPDEDCTVCRISEECPFNNLRGTDDEGEYKDKPRLIVTNLKFTSNVSVGRAALACISDEYRTVVPGRAPVYIEYIEPGADFTFEIILTGDGLKFEEDVERAIQLSIKFFGWGGFCNEGFGRGEVEVVERNSFTNFEEKHITPKAEILEGEKKVTLEIEPLLILERAEGGVYLNVLENGFPKKLSDSINERYWQLYGGHFYLPISEASGRARATTIVGWSRKMGSCLPFKGLGNELTIIFERGLTIEGAKAIALARYGIGKYKNQGFGSLRPKGASPM